METSGLSVSAGCLIKMPPTVDHLLHCFIMIYSAGTEIATMLRKVIRRNWDSLFTTGAPCQPY